MNYLVLPVKFPTNAAAPWTYNPDPFTPASLNTSVFGSLPTKSAKEYYHEVSFGQQSLNGITADDGVPARKRLPQGRARQAGHLRYRRHRQRRGGRGQVARVSDRRRRQPAGSVQRHPLRVQQRVRLRLGRPGLRRLGARLFQQHPGAVGDRARTRPQLRPAARGQPALLRNGAGLRRRGLRGRIRRRVQHDGQQREQRPLQRDPEADPGLDHAEPDQDPCRRHGHLYAFADRDRWPCDLWREDSDDQCQPHLLGRVSPTRRHVRRLHQAAEFSQHGRADPPRGSVRKDFRQRRYRTPGHDAGHQHLQRRRAARRAKLHGQHLWRHHQRARFDGEHAHRAGDVARRHAAIDRHPGDVADARGLCSAGHVDGDRGRDRHGTDRPGQLHGGGCGDRRLRAGAALRQRPYTERPARRRCSCPGTHSIVAIYAGDNNYAPKAAATALSQVVNKAPSSVALASSQNPLCRRPA